MGTNTMMSAVLWRRSPAAVDVLICHRKFSVAAAPSVAEALASGNGAEAKRFSELGVFRQERSLGFQARSFHAKSGPLGFLASAISQAEFAVELDSYGNDEGLEIAKLGISPEIVSALGKKGITKLFPIQRAVLEPAMQGCDMVGRARTGTGKTLAFAIPIMDKIIRFNAKRGRGRNPLALVLAPTRELARQVEKEFQESAPSLDRICVYGGTPISSQMRQLGYGVDIVVGTPGRVIDLLNRGALNLAEVQFLVLDEADQMLQIGFQEAVETILERVPEKRHTMMFSATMPPEIRKITRNYLNNPISIDLVGESDQKLANGISLYSIVSDFHGKASIIGPLITEHAKGGKCIVFTQTKRDASRLSFAMSRSYRCEALHGDISQAQRERTLAGFRDGRFNILVATDVAARGLDIPHVDLVIHFELPNSSEIFVHRSGRTGRAGKKGTAILVYTQNQHRAVRMIERDVGSRFTELPAISGDSSIVMGGDFGGGSGSGSYGGMRDRRSDSRFGHFGGGGGGGGGGGSGRSGYGGRPGFGRSSRYGDSSQMGRSGKYSSERFGSFGDRSGSRFGGSSTNRSRNFGGSGSGRSGGFGDLGSSRNSRASRSGSSGRVGDDF